MQTPSLNLGVIQGFTTAVTKVGGTIAGRRAGDRVRHATRISRVSSRFRDGAFAVPRGRHVLFGASTPASISSRTSCGSARFEILDENGEQLAVAGQLAVHERQVGAVDVTLESRELRDDRQRARRRRASGRALKVTGELTRPKLEGEVRIAAGRLEVDRILQLFYDPYSIEALPEVVSAERTAQASASAAGSDAQALARAGQGVSGAAAPAAAVRRRRSGARAPPARSTNVELDVHVRIPDNLVASRPQAAAGRADASARSAT